MPADELTRELAEREIPERIHWFQLDRRDFLKLCGGGLLVLLEGSSDAAQEAGRGFRAHELPKEVGAWVHIDADGRITVFTGKVEIGQNIRTSLAQLVAEELRVPVGTITMVMGTPTSLLGTWARLAAGPHRLWGHNFEQWPRPRGRC